MKITDVSLTIFSWAATPATQFPGAGEHPRSGDLGYLRIETDDGVVGESFLGGLDNPASTDANKLIRWIKPMLLGSNPLDRERLHRQMHSMVRYCGYRTLGSVDVALWDIAGKVAGLPIHQLLGTARESIPIYVSSQRFDDPAKYADQARLIKDAGWSGYKIHPPKELFLDLAIIDAVREACGPQYPLMLDGGWRYDFTTALQIGQALERADYIWFEDPLEEDDVYGFSKLHEKLMIPLLATEQPSGGIGSYAPWITMRATDMLRGDVPTKGGITTMVKTAHLAEAFGMNYEIHYSGNALCDLAGVHVGMAIANCRFLETLYPDPIHMFGALQGIDVDDSGMVQAPTAPGLGAVIDTDLIERFTETVLV